MLILGERISAVRYVWVRELAVKDECRAVVDEDEDHGSQMLKRMKTVA